LGEGSGTSSRNNHDIDPVDRFLHDVLEQQRSSDNDTAEDAVCSPEFVESLKFVER